MLTRYCVQNNTYMTCHAWQPNLHKHIFYDVTCYDATRNAMFITNDALRGLIDQYCAVLSL